MLLYRCKAPTNRICPCGQVARRLKSQGIEFEQRRVRMAKTAEARPEIVRLTGQQLVPVLVEDDGTAIHGSERIISHLGAVEVA